MLNQRGQSPRYELRKATQKGKKWQIKTPEGKTITFGAFGMEDLLRARMRRGRRGISPDTRRMRIGPRAGLIHLVSGLNIYFGLNPLWLVQSKK